MSKSEGENEEKDAPPNTSQSMTLQCPTGQLN